MTSSAATPTPRKRPRLALLLVGTGALLALLGCDVVRWASPAPRVQGQTSTPSRGIATTGPAGATRQTTIFLPRLLEDDSLRLAPVGRTVADTDNPAAAALDALIQGPNGDERAADFEYALDRRARVLGVAVADGTAVADFGAGLEQVHGRPFSELVYWSLVYTLTEAPGVQRVELRQNGASLSALGDPPFPVPPLGTRDQAPDWARPR